ncbi:MAG: 6-phosphogluconolactonase [Acidobacteriaceae bacterium]|nr:6-phosphogluconolactonase [Acidobacteriaceae bacterium]
MVRAVQSFFILHFLLLSLLGIAAVAEATAGKYLLYVGTYTDHGSKGIYAYRFDPATGQASDLGLAAESVQPSFLTADPNGRFLYAVNETDIYQGQATGSVSAFAIDSATGKLSPLNEVSARGAGTTFITLDRTGKYAFVANYNSGSVAVFRVLQDGKLGESTAFVQHKGSSVDRDRQAGPHPHEVVLSPDNRFAIVADLGIDQLVVYPFDSQNGTLGQPHIIKSSAGAGTRHLVFGRNCNFVYVINELKNTIVSYSYNAKRGELRELQTVSTLPGDFKDTNTTAEIQMDPAGKFLYGSNRGEDSITVFAVGRKSGTLKNVENVSTQGKMPRSFALDPSGEWLVAANQGSNNVVIFRVDSKSGRLTPTGQELQVFTPTYVMFVPVH